MHQAICHIPRINSCRRDGCANGVGRFCVPGYCPQHCRNRTCDCRRPASSAPPQAVPQVQPRRRVCRHANCWVLVPPTCPTGCCARHCNSAECPCSHATHAGVPQRAASRRCKFHGCQGTVGGACLTGYCQLHCTSRRCCGRGRTGVQCRGQNQSCSVAPAPLRLYLSEMCSGLPEDVAHLPANIRSSLEELRSFVEGSGNVGGSRRPRQHRESRPM